MKFVLVLVVVGLCGLSFAVWIHEFSREQTAVYLQELEARRAELEARELDAQAARLQALKDRAEEIAARRARLAAAAQESGQTSAAVAVPGDLAKGRNAFMACAMCHGAQAEGKRAYFAPRLAGQERWYIKDQLRKFKAGVRGSHPQDIYGMQMAMASKMIYSEEMLDNVAAYLASLDIGQAVERGNGDAAAGQRHYALCANCHGPRAQGIEDRGAPGLTNQHAWYLQKQMDNFKSGMRDPHAIEGETQQMLAALELLKDGEIADLVAYIQSHNDQ